MATTRPDLIVMMICMFKMKDHHHAVMVIGQCLLTSGDVELNPGPLDELDLSNITNELGSVIDKWFQIGVQLKLSEAKLRQIEADHHTVDRCFLEVISFWLNGNTKVAATWKSLIEALESSFVNENGLAKKLREKREQNLHDERVDPSLEGAISNSVNSSVAQLNSSISNEAMERAAGIRSSQRSTGTKKHKGHRRKKRKMKKLQLNEGPETKKAKTDGIASKVATATEAEIFDRPHLTFPILDQKKMTREDKELLEQRLYSESVSIMIKFQKLFSATINSLKERKITVKELSNHIGCLHTLKPAYKHSNLGCLGSELPKAETVDDVMATVREYSSFFNFHMIENIITNLGGEQDRINLTNYLGEFADYAKRKVFECPHEVGTMNEDGRANIFVTLDESYDNCTISSLNTFKCELQAILNIPPGVIMTLCRIEAGSVKLTFQVPLFVQQVIFPISDDQKAALVERNVVQISCGFFLFAKRELESKQKHTFQSSLEKDESEEESDSERQSVSTIGKSTVKGNGGASLADSAIDTYTGTRQSEISGGTCIGVSQFSEEMTERNLGDEPHLRMEYDAAKLLIPEDFNELELHQSVRKGKLNEVKQLIQNKNLNPLQKSKYGNTALHIAALGGHLNIMRYFIEKQGLIPACQGELGRTPLHHAAYCKHLELVQYLVGKLQVDPLCKDEHGYTSLHAACQGGDINVIEFLINEIQKYMSLEDVIYEKTKDDYTPLHLAAFHGHLPVVKFFISELNFDPNTPGFMVRSALHVAAQEGHLDVVKYLIEEAKCDPSCCPGEEKVTPLHLAAKNGRLLVVRYLTQEHHSNPLSRDANYNTPLHYAALYGHFEVVKFFISELKCDPNNSGQWGRSPLHFASQHGSLDIVKFLTDDFKCSASQLDEHKVTPLHMAAMNGNLAIVQYLTQEKLCNPICYNLSQDTPLHLAARGGHLEIVKYFIETLRCPLNIRGWGNMTPLERARSHGHIHIVKYLRNN